MVKLLSVLACVLLERKRGVVVPVAQSLLNLLSPVARLRRFKRMETRTEGLVIVQLKRQISRKNRGAWKFEDMWGAGVDALDFLRT